MKKLCFTYVLGEQKELGIRATYNTLFLTEHLVNGVCITFGKSFAFDKYSNVAPWNIRAKFFFC